MSDRPTVEVTITFPSHGVHTYYETTHRLATDEELKRYADWDKARLDMVKAFSTKQLRPLYETLRACFERTDGVDQ